MVPIKTGKTPRDYVAPFGLEDKVGGLPYYREFDVDLNQYVIFSIWEPEDWEREAIADGAKILLGQVGEPIQPVSLTTIEDTSGS